MKLAKALDEKVMDIRLMDRLIAEGKLSKADRDAHLASIPDDEGNYEQIGTATVQPTE